MSLFRRLDEEEAIVRGELDALREKIAATEERLARLVITRETARQLLGPEEGEPVEPAAAPMRASVAEPDGESLSRLAVLDRKLAALEADLTDLPTQAPEPQAAGSGAGRVEWAEGLRRIESLLATSGRLMRVREIAVAIGEGTTPARIETTRGRCKHLVKAGKVVEVEPGRFRVAGVRGGGEVPDVR